MSLIKCSECGKEYSDESFQCPNCGKPNENRNVKEEVSKYKGKFSVARLVISIISFIIVVIVFIQSCATGVANAIEENSDIGGSAGIMLMIFMLVAAIVGIVTRNSRSKVGPIVAGSFYLVGGLLAILISGDTYKDLPIWCVISMIFGVVFIIAGILTKKE